jgi:phosphoribosyl-AMP cyclohydrolase
LILIFSEDWLCLSYYSTEELEKFQKNEKDTFFYKIKAQLWVRKYEKIW